MTEGELVLTSATQKLGSKFTLCFALLLCCSESLPSPSGLRERDPSAMQWSRPCLGWGVPGTAHPGRDGVGRALGTCAGAVLHGSEWWCDRLYRSARLFWDVSQVAQVPPRSVEVTFWASSVIFSCF
ncbi:hypothetical protein KC19_6G109600 [Ceratodon purpureus]|uniref:Uncharacterized protein n=1 Tax=Ceratodon purpureus TaxID=3225 RepID=A0A8T0HH62_CERPU|nr:hypothetical protein KC19_6G109600 [Ceratodon purpureus]